MVTDTLAVTLKEHVICLLSTFSVDTALLQAADEKPT